MKLLVIYLAIYVVAIESKRLKIHKKHTLKKLKNTLSSEDNADLKD